MADKTNTFIEIWSGDKLIDIILPEPSTATAKSPTPLDRELVKVFRDRRALLAVCKKIEWSDRDSFYNPRCPDCCSLEKQGHDDKCELKAAIALKEGEK